MQPPADGSRATLRAADSDREGVAALLRQHFEDGRLTIDEFQERVARAYESKTLGELDTLSVDLPALAKPGPKPVTRRQQNLRNHVLGYVLICLFLIAIWAVSGANGSFWPIWPILVGGLWLAFDVLGIERPRRGRGRRHRRM